jgi:hypothetical protein
MISVLELGNSFSDSICVSDIELTPGAPIKTIMKYGMLVADKVLGTEVYSDSLVGCLNHH